MKSRYNTPRLRIDLLEKTDASFMLELMNTIAWLKFIGDRNIIDIAAAETYIAKIIADEHMIFWKVILKDTLQPIGICTYIKRAHLAHGDFGFAFLPAATGLGLAYEASSVVLKDLLNSDYSSPVLAVTKSENLPSMRLLKRLGFHFSKEIEDGLLLFSS